ncbi:MAG: SDR family NAD(P)-dependent oxidoreductase [Pseudoflavonifractor sp.]|nr:SDR family NAD(P)-dependent oxidoreductase [Pseudoflavonifractor sp.]
MTRSIDKQTEPTYIVTGATGGIGSAIAGQLVSRGIPRLILACRNTSRASALADRLKADYPSSPTVIQPLTLDLSDMTSVRAFADSVISSGDQVTALINNAGTMPPEIIMSKDGIESATATNLVSTVLLTELLLPIMTEGGAIVMTTSMTRKIVRLRPDWLAHAAHYHGFMRRFKTYGRSKLMLTHYAADLSRRLTSRGIRVNCADPGIVDSDILKMDNIVIDRLADLFFRPLISTTAQGANAALSALDSPLTARIFMTSGQSKPIPASYLTDPLHAGVMSRLLETALGEA